MVSGKKDKPRNAPFKPTQRVGSVVPPPSELIPEKEAKVLKGVLIEGLTPRKALQAAGYDGVVVEDPVRAKETCDFIKKKHPNVNLELLKSLKNVGITPDYVAQKVKDLCEAKRQIPVKKTKTKSDGLEVEDIEYKEVDDFSAQHKGINTLLDILPDSRAPKRVEVTQQSFEEKVSIHAEITANPAASISIIQKLIEQKITT